MQKRVLTDPETRVQPGLPLIGMPLIACLYLAQTTALRQVAAPLPGDRSPQLLLCRSTKNPLHTLVTVRLPNKRQ